MSTKDLTITLDLDRPAHEVFDAVCNVQKWWTENTKGGSHALNDEFTVQFEDIHFSKQKLVEVVPDKKLVWLVTDSRLSFLRDQQEWTNTKIVFDISAHGDKTQLKFTHIGLNPEVECYKDCSNGWNYYMGSLGNFITSGKGQPEKIK